MSGHTIRELGGEPALPALRGAIEGLAPSERAMIANGLLLGIVLDGDREAGVAPALTTASSCAG